MFLYITTDFIPDAQPPLQYPNIGLNKLLITSEIALQIRLVYLNISHRFERFD